MLGFKGHMLGHARGQELGPGLVDVEGRDVLQRSVPSHQPDLVELGDLGRRRVSIFLVLAETHIVKWQLELVFDCLCLLDLRRPFVVRLWHRACLEGRECMNWALRAG